MDWSEKAAWTALTVALLLAAGRCFGGRVAGVLAGLPTVTGPALIWLGVDHGVRYAAEAAIGSIAACALCAAFALAYERTSRHRGAPRALAAASLAGLLLALPLPALRGEFVIALGFAALVSLASYAAMPRPRDEPRRGGFGTSRETILTVLVAAAVSALVAVAAPQVGAFWAGVLASPPLIAAVLAMHQHVCAGPAAACRVLRGYVAGLLGRAVFGASFALLVVPFGLTEACLAASLAGCALTALTMKRL